MRLWVLKEKKWPPSPLSVWMENETVFEAAADSTTADYEKAVLDGGRGLDGIDRKSTVDMSDWTLQGWAQLGSCVLQQRAKRG